MKVTVEQFLNAGFEFVKGDKVTNGTGYCIVGDDIDAWTANHNHPRYKKFIAKSLAPRTNLGKQPVADDCVVEVTLRGGGVTVSKAIDLDWRSCLIFDSCIIETWKPSLKHLEQQMNKQESAMNISERDIEDAIDNSDVERVLAESDEQSCESQPSHNWEQDTCTKCGDKDYLSPDKYCSESKLKGCESSRSVTSRIESDEWVNGDKVLFDLECTGVFIGYLPENKNMCIVHQPNFVRVHYVSVSDLSKPLTPEQLAAKEAMAWHSYFDTLSVMEISELLVSKGLYAPDEYRK